ncbi:hypothetical protein OKW13_001255 [Bacillus velezensis]|nr:hypothetical protein [Bacillus velezensis]
MNTADMLTTYLSKLPNLIIALLVLLIGWGIAKIIEKAVYKGLQKTKIDDRLFAEKKPARYSSEKVISKVIYFIALIIVFILFFNILHLTTVASPFVSMLSAITAAVPSILKAGLILLVGWAAASLFSYLVKKAGMKLAENGRLRKWTMVSEEAEMSRSVTDRFTNRFLLRLALVPARRLGRSPNQRSIRAVYKYDPKRFVLYTEIIRRGTDCFNRLACCPSRP